MTGAMALAGEKGSNEANAAPNPPILPFAILLIGTGAREVVGFVF
jgi:hypothetical protein